LYLSSNWISPSICVQLSSAHAQAAAARLGAVREHLIEVPFLVKYRDSVTGIFQGDLTPLLRRRMPCSMAGFPSDRLDLLLDTSESSLWHSKCITAVKSCRQLTFDGDHLKQKPEH
jgi:hypothetical protein